MIIICAGAGCSTSPYDEEGFSHIDAYAEEMIPATISSLYSLTVWSEAPKDQTTLDDLQTKAGQIRKINKQYWTEEMPGKQEIETWRIERENQEEKWVIEGEKLAEALFDLKEASSSLANLLEKAADSRSEDKLQVNLEDFIIDSLDRAEKLRWLLYRR